MIYYFVLPQSNVMLNPHCNYLRICNNYALLKLLVITHEFIIIFLGHEKY